MKGIKRRGKREREATRDRGGEEEEQQLKEEQQEEEEVREGGTKRKKRDLACHFTNTFPLLQVGSFGR